MRYFVFLLIILLPVYVFCQDKNTKIREIKEKVARFKISDLKETTAIAGVRGADEDRTEDLYWAGKDSVSKEELEIFKNIIADFEKDNTEKAKKDLELFLIKYPNSALSKDAWDLLNILKSE